MLPLPYALLVLVAFAAGWVSGVLVDRALARLPRNNP